MGRSKWKAPFLKIKISQAKYLLVSRSTEILPRFINESFYVHNGKAYVKVDVSENFVGHKFGEFVPSRQRYIYKKKK